ncbi:MAG: hypothetical protein BWX86_01399 [Verrucomicrobia bacterium ADurb.Bin122]|nr:MAG: hypothetical protein BWX86_01399 [Verrucomicrobia bacterium ADurb.Bin122]
MGDAAGEQADGLDLLGLAQLVFEPALLGDVVEHHDDADGSRVVVADGGGVGGDEPCGAGAVREQVGQAQVDRLARAEDFADGMGRGRGAVVGQQDDDFLEVVALGVICMPPGELFGHGVERDDAADGIGGDHGVTDRGECDGEVLLALAQLCFGVALAAAGEDEEEDGGALGEEDDADGDNVAAVLVPRGVEPEGDLCTFGDAILGDAKPAEFALIKDEAALAMRPDGNRLGRDPREYLRGELPDLPSVEFAVEERAADDAVPEQKIPHSVNRRRAQAARLCNRFLIGAGGAGGVAVPGE